MFSDADYVLNLNKQKTFREPTELPLENDVIKLRNFTITEIKLKIFKNVE